MRDKAARKERFCSVSVPQPDKAFWEQVMGFPWPVTDGELLLDDALDIAMRSFDLPSNEEDHASVEKLAAEAILDEWKLGVRHKILLANKAIAVVEEHHPRENKLRRTPNAS